MRWAFNVAAITAGMAILLIMFVPDQRQTPRRPSPARLGKLFLSPVVLIPSLLSCLFHYADWSSTASFLPILARQLGATEVKVSLLVTLNMGVSLIGEFDCHHDCQPDRLSPDAFYQYHLTRYGSGKCCSFVYIGLCLSLPDMHRPGFWCGLSSLNGPQH